MYNFSFCWKCKNKVQLRFYCVESAKRYGSEFVPLERPKGKIRNLFS